MAIKTVPPVSSGLETFDSRFGIPRPYGFVSAFKASFESISTVTVGSGGAAYVEFTSIPQTFTHLQIRGIARLATGSDWLNPYIRINGDTANNYSLHSIYATGSAIASAGYSSLSAGILGIIPTAAITANSFGAYVIDIVDYSNSFKNTTIRSNGSSDANVSGWAYLTSNGWHNTNPVTSITIYEPNNNLAQHSTFALYGVEAQ